MNYQTELTIEHIKSEAAYKFGNHDILINEIAKLVLKLDIDQVEDLICRLPEVRASLIWNDFLKYRGINDSEKRTSFTDYALGILSGEEVYRLYVPPAKNTRGSNR